MSHLFLDARYRPTAGLSGERRLDRVAGVIWHVSASEAPSLFRYFDGQSGGVESHFHVARDGTVEQYRPGDAEADANYRGNSWLEGGVRWGFLSIEFQGADPVTGRWTPEQVASGLAITEWAQQRYGFARQLAPSFHGQGIGYHVMFGAGAGLDAWSNARGKTCPGGRRVSQFRGEVVPTFLHLVRTLGSRVLGKDDAGTDVAELQTLLGHGLVADGDFGPQTDAVVRAFQAARGLTVDGLVGAVTLAALRAGATPAVVPVPIPPVVIPTPREDDHMDLSLLYHAEGTSAAYALTSTGHRVWVDRAWYDTLVRAGRTPRILAVPAESALFSLPLLGVEPPQAPSRALELGA